MAWAGWRPSRIERIEGRTRVAHREIAAMTQTKFEKTKPSSKKSFCLTDLEHSTRRVAFQWSVPAKAMRVEAKIFVLVL